MNNWCLCCPLSNVKCVKQVPMSGERRIGGGLGERRVTRLCNPMWQCIKVGKILFVPRFIVEQQSETERLWETKLYIRSLNICLWIQGFDLSHSELFQDRFWFDLIWGLCLGCRHVFQPQGLYPFHPGQTAWEVANTRARIITGKTGLQFGANSSCDRPFLVTNIQRQTFGL